MQRTFLRPGFYDHAHVPSLHLGLVYTVKSLSSMVSGLSIPWEPFPAPHLTPCMSEDIQRPTGKGSPSSTVTLR